MLVTREVFDQPAIVGDVAVLDQRRAIVVNARVCSGGCLVVGLRLARADPAAQPVPVQRATRQPGQQQAGHAREHQDDPDDVHVQPVREPAARANRKMAPAVMRKMPVPVRIPRLPPGAGSPGWPRPFTLLIGGPAVRRPGR